MPRPDTTLILTNSHDVTVDLLLERLPAGREQVFRLNFDLFHEYNVCLTPTGFAISDPTGRTIDQDTIHKAYYRKPTLRSHQQAIEDYVEGEQWAVFRALVFLLWEMQKLVLVEPFSEKARLNKMYQLRMAADIFNVPATYFTSSLSQHPPRWQQTVVKSLTGGLLGERTLFTTLVDPYQLDPAYPWLLQQYIEARYDLTVVVVRDKVFSFRLDRDFLNETVDFRAPADGSTWDAWQPCSMPESFEAAVLALMKRFRLDYGRLDFLMMAEDEVYFCEVNPNGQFAWLDLQDSVGLLSAVAHEIDPTTPCYPISYTPYPA